MVPGGMMAAPAGMVAAPHPAGGYMLLPQMMAAQAQQQAAVSEFRDQTTASNRALVNLTNSLMMREATGADGLWPVDERSRLAGTRLSINQGLNVISDPNLDYETMLKALDQLGFREADLENLATAAGATIRQRVRNASPRELVYMNQNPVYAQYIDQNTLQNAQNIIEAERENVINRVRALEQSRELGVPIRPEQRRVPRFRPQEVRAPGEGITTTPIDPTDYMLARQEAAPAYGEARSARIQQQQERVDGLYPPSPPARQPPTITQAQRAVFADLDDDTLRTLANRSIYAAQELAQRGRERQAAPPAEEAPPAAPAAPETAPATTATATPTAQPAAAPAPPAPPVVQTGIPIFDQPPSEEEQQQIRAYLQTIGQQEADITGLPPIPSATAPAQRPLSEMTDEELEAARQQLGGQ